LDHEAHLWEVEDVTRGGTSTGADFPIVAIGASAGGVEAMTALFSRLPAQHDAAFLIITHLAPQQKSLLPEILGRCTAMAVTPAQDGEAIEPGHVYVLPPDTVMTVADGCLALAPRGQERNVIDVCLASLADEAGERAVAVILSGTGTDGAIGIKAVRAAGGFTLAQGSDGSAPGHAGMPDAAAATGFVDFILPIEALADRLATYLNEPGDPLETSDPQQLARLEKGRRELCDRLHAHLGHDFSGYKQNTFMRRVGRRMQMRRTADLQAYLKLVEAEPDELEALFVDLLIGVTEFFRDLSSFEALSELVAPSLLEGKGPDDTVRIWVPGCSTGEEAYSIAIMLLERFGRAQAQPRLQVFATDLDERALTIARAGRYPARLLTGMAPDRLQRFFTEAGSSYVVSKELRDACIFSCHNLIRDPPFSRMDLISCRNLLIYLDVDLQNQVIPLFHYALRPKGYLFLGASEHISHHSKLFSSVEKKHRIFQRRDLAVRPPLFTASRVVTPGTAIAAPPVDAGGIAGCQQAVRRFEAVVLERYAPAHVVVNGEWEVLHYSARTGRYLEQPVGAPNRNLLAMARNGLRQPLRSALYEAAETRRRVVRERVRVETEGGYRAIDLTVEPLHNEPFWLIVFNDQADVAELEGSGDEIGTLSNSDADVDHIELELRQTREQLRASVEEYQSMVEELKSANEELLSVNEELQSSNEELESAKEELQSVNEELHTVNGELSRKIEELDRSNSDLKNLFDSTNIATLFLDGNLVIRSFTPAVSDVFKVIPGDCGRPLSDIVSFLSYEDLATDVAAVLATMSPVEKELVGRDGATHYLMRIHPYRTVDGLTDGVVVTFVNVTPLVKLGEQQALVAELNHRVKNILAVVASMATQMAQRCGSVEEFAEAFIGRIHGLAKTHEVLSLNRWTRVDLRQLITAELSAFVADTARAVLEGPEVHLQPRATTTLGIIIHELATNALKYGAFATPGGRLSVHWTFEDHAGSRTFVLHWRERGGPPVIAPKHKGFGTDLIERSLEFEFGGSAVLDFAPGGLVATLSIPANEVIEMEVVHGTAV
jgi:two-component system CheB/CheR fusion protein